MQHWERLEREVVHLESMANIARDDKSKVCWIDKANAMRRQCHIARRTVDDVYRRNTQ